VTNIAKAGLLLCILHAAVLEQEQRHFLQYTGFIDEAGQPIVVYSAREDHGKRLRSS
jgi:hypothetical protein